MGKLSDLGHKFNNCVCLKLASLSSYQSHRGQDLSSAILIRFWMVSLGFATLQEKKRFERAKKQSNLLFALKIILCSVCDRHSRHINVQSIKDRDKDVKLICHLKHGRKNPFYLEGRKIKVGVAEGKHVEGQSQQPLSPSGTFLHQTRLLHAVLRGSSESFSTQPTRRPRPILSCRAQGKGYRSLILGQLSPNSGTAKVNREAA